MPPPDQFEMSEEDWRRDRRLVMSELTRIGNKLDTLTSTVNGDVTNMKVEVATLKTKVGLYAALISAVAAAIISAAVSYIMRH